MVAALVGCAAGPPARMVPVSLGRNARVMVDGVLLERGPDGRMALPAPHDETQELRIEEPGKASLTAVMRVLVDPPPSIEDQLMRRSGANTVIFYSEAERGGVFEVGVESAHVLPEPLALLRLARGPWFLPAEGQGVVIVGQPAGTRVQAGGAALIIDPLPDGSGARPLVVSLPEGEHEVRVEREGRAPFARTVSPEAGEYELLCVHLAPALGGATGTGAE
jgi:hypothetical protein